MEVKRAAPAPGSEAEVFGVAPRRAPTVVVTPAAPVAVPVAVPADAAVQEQLALLEQQVADLRASFTSQQQRLSAVETKVLTPPGAPFDVAQFYLDPSNPSRILGFRTSQGRNIAFSSPIIVGETAGVTTNGRGQIVVTPQNGGSLQAVLPAVPAPVLVQQAQRQRTPSIPIVPPTAAIPPAPALTPPAAAGPIQAAPARVDLTQQLAGARLRPAVARQPEQQPPSSTLGQAGGFQAPLAFQQQVLARRAAVAGTPEPAGTPRTGSAMEWD